CGYGKYGAKLSKRLSAKDLYEISVDTLEREIYVIGIAELFEQSIFTFAALCGIESVSAWATDVRNKNRPLINEISSSDQDLIREFFEWDFQLYEYALERFHKQANHIQFGSSLEVYQDACKGQYKDRLIS
ncbi:MAG TPA: hypothetical protein VFJ18_12300, partial [Pararhizobium sp.]|nr:hypothetical protein [Pararhizobium sp.]